MTVKSHTPSACHPQDVECAYLSIYGHCENQRHPESETCENYEVRCDTCWNIATDTRRVFLKDGSAFRDPWRKTPCNMCGRCRRHYHGLFKYVR